MCQWAGALSTRWRAAVDPRSPTHPPTHPPLSTSYSITVLFVWLPSPPTRVVPHLRRGLSHTTPHHTTPHHTPIGHFFFKPGQVPVSQTLVGRSMCSKWPCTASRSLPLCSTAQARTGSISRALSSSDQGTYSLSKLRLTDGCKFKFAACRLLAAGRPPLAARRTGSGGPSCMPTLSSACSSCGRRLCSQRAMSR